jgi:hypothetical protein
MCPGAFRNARLHMIFVLYTVRGAAVYRGAGKVKAGGNPSASRGH